MQGVDFITQYECSVLEWFNRAYKGFTQMIYAQDILSLVVDSSAIKYPTLLYHRTASTWDFLKAMPVVDTDASGQLVRSVVFSTTQDYEAAIYLQRESDLAQMSNVIRQYWAKNSYAFVRMSPESTLSVGGVSDDPFILRVGMRYVGIDPSTERTNIDPKGARRVLRVKWQSVLLICDEEIAPRYSGFQLVINARGEAEASKETLYVADYPLE